jgi:hypothetical protein
MMKKEGASAEQRAPFFVLTGEDPSTSGHEILPSYSIDNSA